MKCVRHSIYRTLATMLLSFVAIGICTNQVIYGQYYDDETGTAQVRDPSMADKLMKNLQNESKMMISTEDLSLMTQYCHDPADRAAAGLGENVINDLAAIGSVPSNLGNLTCAAVSGIEK